MVEWFSMGGYGAFVWPSYIATAVGFVGLCIWFWRDYRTACRAAGEDQ